jgi:hypothetical protein
MANLYLGRNALKTGALALALAIAAAPLAAAYAASRAPCTADDPMSFDDGPTRCTSQSSADPMNLGSNDFLSNSQSGLGMGDPLASSGPATSNAQHPAGITGSISPSVSPAQTNAVATWFENLSPTDQQRILQNAASEGLTDDKGRPFTAREFLALSAVMDQELQRHGLNDADKREIFHAMEQSAGVGGAAH